MLFIVSRAEVAKKLRDEFIVTSGDFTESSYSTYILAAHQAGSEKRDLRGSLTPHSLVFRTPTN